MTAKMTFNPTSPSTPELVISIVNYRGWPHLGACLERICPAAERGRYPVYVTDNHSCDGSISRIAAEFPGVRLIHNETNVGFGAAHNQVVASTASRYVLILNPDTLVPADGVAKMLRFMDEHPWVGVLGAKLLNRDASIQHSCRRFPNVFTILLRGLGIETWHPDAEITRRYFMLNFDHETTTEVDWVMGACMLLRRQALEQVGSFDEGYFLYYEDVDLCYRMWPDWKVVYYPHVTIVHHHLQQSHKLRHLRQFVTHVHSVSRFFRKYGLSPRRPTGAPAREAVRVTAESNKVFTHANLRDHRPGAAPRSAHRVGRLTGR